MIKDVTIMIAMLWMVIVHESDKGVYDKFNNVEDVEADRHS